MSLIVSILSLGAMASVLLLGALFLNFRRAKEVSLEDRLFRRNNAFKKEEEEKKKSYLKRLEEDLAHGRTGISVSVYFLIMAVAAVLIFIVISYLTESYGVAALAGCFAVLVPREVVRMISDSKKREFDMMFCKALKRLSASLRTGSSLLQAVSEIAESETLPVTIREEMAQVRTDYEYGYSMEEAFNFMYERTGVEDVRGVALAIEIASRKGTKLFETFDIYAEAILERKEGEAEARAALSGTRMTVNVGAAMPFVFAAMMKVISPGYFDSMYALWNGNGSYIMLAIYAVAVIGYYICRKMLDIRL